MDNSSLICFDAILGVAHIGRMSIAVGPVQRLCKIEKAPDFFITPLLNLESVSTRVQYYDTG